MPDLKTAFVYSFIPLFIVIDAFGILPIVLGLGEGLEHRERRRMVHVAVITAGLVGLAFLFLGRFILNVLDISVGAFAIAGGIILLVLSIRYMTTGHMMDVIKEEMVAIVPIGTPLLAGPATITTLLLLVTQYQWYIVLVAFALNIAIAWLMFLQSGWIIRIMGRGGVRAASRVFSLLLAAIAVSMVIKGLDMVGIVSTTG